MRDTPRPLVLAVIAQVVVGVAIVGWALAGFPVPGNADEPDPARTAAAAGRPDRFDADRAFAFARFQVREIGPRPAGSRASRRLAAELRRRLPRGRLEAIPGHPGLRNVVGTIPGRAPAILVGAHYDTEARPRGHLGANDGAAGTAAVVELARVLRASPVRDGREVRFVLFDGEEEPAGCDDFLACGLRGSKAYAAAHADEIGDMVLLDYIAERTGLRIPRELGSDPGLWARLRAAAARVGAERVFPPATQGQILDDHYPFTQRGVRAIDLIDFDYPERDTLRDDLSRISARSLDLVGETVAELVLELRRGRE
jgi:hypothetical protein